MAMWSLLIENVKLSTIELKYISLTQNDEEKEIEDATYKLKEPKLMNFKLVANEGILQPQRDGVTPPLGSLTLDPRDSVKSINIAILLNDTSWPLTTNL